MKMLALLIGIVICLSVIGCGWGQARSPGDLEEASILDLIDLIPLSELSEGGSLRIVYINDYGRAREAHGIQAPATDASDDELMEYLLELESTGLAPGPWISGYARTARAAQLEQAKHLGFGIGEVEQSVFFSRNCPITLEAVVGRIDPEVTESSLRQLRPVPGYRNTRARRSEIL